jgi:protein-disulfide isomerase
MASEHPPLTEGDPESPVRVITYEDLQCKDCAWLRRKMDEVILPEFGGHVAFEHRDFPLAKHDWAKEASMAARFFATIGYGTAIAFRRTILSEISIITKESLPGWVRDFAVDYGADPDEAEASMSDPVIAAVIEAEVQAGLARGVEKTPTIFVGDITFVEWMPLEDLSAAITAEVEKKR